MIVGLVDRAEDVEGLVVEEQHMAMSVLPIGPLEAAQRDVSSGLVKALGGLLDVAPELGVTVEEAQAPMIVVRDAHDVDAGDIATVGVEIFG